MGDLTGNFSSSEFHCKCGKCDGGKISISTVAKLQFVRTGFGRSIVPNSATRCLEYNKEVGGTDNSAHLEDATGDSHAVDIPVANNADRFKLLDLAFKAGFKGIGFYSNFIHLDDAPRRDIAVSWYGKY
jgi:uncharacterized protein YcbK (DUF882 family)